MATISEGLGAIDLVSAVDEGAPLLGQQYEDRGQPRRNETFPDGQAFQDVPSPYWAGETSPLLLPWWKRPSVLWLLPPFVLFTMAFGGSMVPKINLILTMICRQYLSDKAVQNPNFQFMPVIMGADNPQCQTPEIQALVARFSLLYNLVTGLLAAFTSPRLGELSDRYGRVRIIALATSGLLLSEVITVVAASRPDTVSVNWLLFGSMLDGIAGSFIAAIALTHSYAADCTPPERRSEVFGYFHGVLFTGIAAGPILAGYLVKATGTLLSVFYASLACHLVFLSVLLLVVPESLSPHRQMAAREKHRAAKETASPRSIGRALRKANVFAPLRVFYPTGEGTKSAVRRNLLLLAAVDATMFGVAMGTGSIIVLYGEFMFGWGNFESSVFMSVVSTSRVSALLILLPLINRLCRPRPDPARPRRPGSDRLDLIIIRVAVAFDTLGYLGYALALKGKVFMLSGAIAAIGGIGSPTLQSGLTKHVAPDRTGQILGAVGLLHALARVVSPTALNLIYSLTVGKATPTVFFLLTGTFCLAFVLSWFIKPHVSLDGPDRDDVQGEEGVARPVYAD
ncbi:MAG: hypothetical protein M1826_000307 [Phylliscum demangeonii]|nr:MAG: hypothetical protein M1826_000307 [Phylliscum demangeonii]